ncbi:hypothetical protein GQ457_02G013010 [Hibiscus cannabinus]
MSHQADGNNNIKNRSECCKGEREDHHAIIDEQETELAARTDGTIVLRTKTSKRVIWSFASGSPIYTSYQAPPTSDNGNETASRPTPSFFIDCVDDWELYAHVTHSNKMNLSKTCLSPHVSEEGAITVGSKRTTVYVVDTMTGKPLHELLKSAASSTAPRRFHITRTDYTLQSFHPNSDKVSWSLMVSEIGAALLCHDVTFTENSTYEFPEIGSDFRLPFPCQSKGIVIREHDTAEYTIISHHGNPMLPLPAPNAPTSPVKLDSTSDDHHNRKIDNETSAPGFLLENNDSRVVDIHDLRAPRTDKAIFAKYPVILSFILFFIILVAFVINHVLLAKKFAALKDRSVADINAAGPSKRKKSRRSGKSNGSIEDGFSPEGGDNKILLDLNKLVGCVDGRRIGKLIVSSTEIAKGSNGTIVLEGFYEGRAVAVKRLVQAHHDVAFKEIENLIASDQHPNIVRWHGVEYDQDFVYLALERCTCSVDDLIQIYSDTSRNPILSMVEHKIHLSS